MVEKLLLVPVEVMLGILPRVGNLIDNFPARHFHYIGYRADSHNFVVSKRDCKLFLGRLSRGFLPLFFFGKLFFSLCNFDLALFHPHFDHFFDGDYIGEIFI